MCWQIFTYNVHVLSPMIDDIHLSMFVWILVAQFGSNDEWKSMSHIFNPSSLLFPVKIRQASSLSQIESEEGLGSTYPEHLMPDVFEGKTFSLITIMIHIALIITSDRHLLSFMVTLTMLGQLLCAFH